jgi:hypothetical protein
VIPYHTSLPSVAATLCPASPSRKTVAGALALPGARASATSAPSCSVSYWVQGWIPYRATIHPPIARRSLQSSAQQISPSIFSALPSAFSLLQTRCPSIPFHAVLSLQTQGCRSLDLCVGRWVPTAHRATRGSTAPTARVWPAGDSVGCGTGQWSLGEVLKGPRAGP